MSNVLILVSKEQYSSNRTKLALKLASNIQKKGNSTTIYLIEDGVYLAGNRQIGDLINAGITVKAEKWDIKARGLNEKIKSEVKISDYDDLISEIAEKNDLAIWF